MKELEDFGTVLAGLPPNATVVIHSGCAEPLYLAEQLARHAAAAKGLTLYTLMPMGAAPYADAAMAAHLSVATFFPGKALRDAANNGQARVLRCAMSEIPALFASGRLRADLLLLQVSPPTQQGQMSLGISVDYMRAVLDQDPLVIAEINRRMPTTCGDTRLTTDQVDLFVETSAPPTPFPPADPDDTDRCIAENIASLVDSGDVIQAGIGALPDLMLAKLGHLRDLGLHSGVITDAGMRLIQSGMVTNATKTEFRGKTVATQAIGTQDLYDFLHGNAAVELHPCSLTHGFATLAAIDRLCSVNSVLQVDLAGNGNAERVGGRVISTPGGLPDFTRGASAAKQGKSILALRAAAKGRSNIVARFPADAPCSVDGAHIGFIVTEYGIARLNGASPQARREALIAVAHPDFRAELRQS
jgi:4-hydroxybutyrate CoA-transferase